MSGQLAILPILIPLAAAALQVLMGARRRVWQVAIDVLAALLLVVVAVALLVRVSDPDATTLVYRLGGWPAPFAIVLVVDRLAALMLFLLAVLVAATLPCRFGRWQRLGPHFRPLVQLFVMGASGVFLTGDLFNLFVFFEILLAASYGLALHGSGRRRVGASLHYLIVNLTASSLFLLGIALIHAATGSLNLAELAARMAGLDAQRRALVQAGATLLGMAFMTKTAIWPLGFWLPRTYAAASPPAAALFAVMTKLGIYVLLRLSRLWFGPAAGAAAGFGHGVLLAAGLITLATGAIGVLGARRLGHLAGHCVLVSAGTLLGAIALDRPAVTAGALAYLGISLFAIAVLFLLEGLLTEREEDQGAERLEPYDPRADALYAAEDETRVHDPAPAVLLAGAFFICSLLLAGLPPLPGFLAKFALLAPLLAGGAGAKLLFALILVAGLCTLIALCRAGIQIFWADPERRFPRVSRGEALAPLALLAICSVFTVFVAGPWRYLDATARQLHAPQNYIHAVLPQTPAEQP